MSFETIIPKIKELLNETDKIEFVSNNPETEISDYPAAIFFPTEHEAEFETFQENERRYIFTIYLLQEKEHMSSEKAEEVLYVATDNVIDKFDKNKDLDGTVQWNLAMPGRWWDGKRDVGAVIVSEVTLTCVKFVNVSS